MAFCAVAQLKGSKMELLNLDGLALDITSVVMWGALLYAVGAGLWALWKVRGCTALLAALAAFTVFAVLARLTVEMSMAKGMGDGPLLNTIVGALSAMVLLLVVAIMVTLLARARELRAKKKEHQKEEEPLFIS